MLTWCACLVVVNLGFITGQEMLVAPVNTAAERGSFARLNCTADLATSGGGEDSLEWRHYIDGTTGDRIVISSDPNDIKLEGYSLDYDVNAGRYDLIVDMNRDLGGKYNCYIMVADINGEAELVALDAFGCGTRNDVTKVIEGQSVALDCEVSYKGYKKPSLEWASENSMLQGYYVEDEENPEKLFYVANVTAQAGHDKMEFTCSLAFGREGGEEEEPPHYKDSCTTTFEVEHGATAIEIYPNPDNADDGIIDIDVGSEMNCTASGNPEPAIYWYDAEGGIITEGSTMVIEESMVNEEPADYKCVASNMINMVEYKTEKTVPVRVFAADESQPPVTEGGLEGWEIALIVVIPLLVIAGVGAALFYMWWKKRKDSDAATHEKPVHYPTDNVEPNPIYESEDKPKDTNRQYDQPPHDTSGGFTGPGYEPPPSGRDSPGYGDLGIKHFGVPVYPGVSPNVSQFPGGQSTREMQPKQYDNQVFDQSLNNERRPSLSSAGSHTMV